MQLTLDSPLFDERRAARATDPATSKAAARNAAAFASGHKARILAALKQHGPMSPAQMFTFTGLSVVQCDRRRREMIEAGQVRILTSESGAALCVDGCEVWSAI
jgi:hypothetical protein